MFCSNCGSRLPDGSKHCAFCGTATAAARPDYQTPQPPQQPSYQAPQQPSYQSPSQQEPNYFPTFDAAPTYIPAQMPEYDLGPSVPENYVDRDRVRKGKFLRSYAKGGTKVLAIVAWILAIAFAGALFLAGSAVLHTPVVELPAIKLCVELEILDDVYELERMREDLVMDLLRAKYSEGLSRSEQRVIDDALKILEKEFSIGSILDGAALAAELSEDSLSGVDAISNQMTMDMVKVILNFTYILAGLFLLIAILRYSGGWIWPAMILSVFHALVLSGLVYAGAILGLGIALIVVLGNINRAYRNFKLA